ncbi:MAG TPA: CD225/dispanin family protein [Thermoanaerobaculia bacterium]|nr:CD225/dispanin family protein [Thermoanaerobaculia bacterium]
MGATPPPPPPPPAQSYTPPSYTPAQQSYAPPPPPAGPSYAGEQIPNYLWQSIVVTLCCCLPLGVVAIIFAAQVNSKLAAGDVAGARDASDKAKLFCWIGFGLGIVANIIMGLMYGAAFFASIANQ